MKKNFTYSILLISIATVVIHACADHSTPVKGIQTGSSAIRPAPIDSTPLPGNQGPRGIACIPPVVAFAYPTDIPPVLPLAEETPMAPLGSWQTVADLPLAGQEVSRLIVRSSNEIWMTHYPVHGGLWRYHLDSGKWKQYASIQGTSVFIDELFLTPQDDLWIIGYITANGTERSGSFFFAHYDPAYDEFRFSQVGSEIFQKFNVTVMRQDQKGTVWLMAQKKSQRFPDLLVAGEAVTLFSVDLSVKKIQRFQDFPWRGYFELGPDGSLWMMADDNGPLIQQFVPSTGEIRQYPGYPPAVSGIRKASDVQLLYFDRLGNLWFDDRGWLDLKDAEQPLWNQVVRSSVFLTDRGEAETRYVWLRPTKMYQSTDGMYWFEYFYGLVQLNPKTGEWCKFTNGRSPFAEDSQGNLWIGVFGKLYKLPPS